MRQGTKIVDACVCKKSWSNLNQKFKAEITQTFYLSIFADEQFFLLIFYNFLVE